MFDVYSVTFPKADNDGASLEAAHEALVQGLLNTFGGLSIVPVRGAWKDDTGRVYWDDSYRYEIAIDRNSLDYLDKIGAVYRIARTFGARMKQLAVYVTGPSGAEIIDMAGYREAEAA